jgi:hypothetical protein
MEGVNIRRRFTLRPIGGALTDDKQAPADADSQGPSLNDAMAK